MDLDLVLAPLLNLGTELCAVPQALQDAVEEAIVLSDIVLQAGSGDVSLCFIQDGIWRDFRLIGCHPCV